MRAVRASFEGARSVTLVAFVKLATSAGYAPKRLVRVLKSGTVPKTEVREVDDEFVVPVEFVELVDWADTPIPAIAARAALLKCIFT